MLKQYPNEYQIIEQVEIILRDKLKNWVTDTSMIQQITWQSSAEIIEKVKREIKNYIRSIISKDD